MLYYLDRSGHLFAGDGTGKPKSVCVDMVIAVIATWRLEDGIRVFPAEERKLRYGPRGTSRRASDGGYLLPRDAIVWQGHDEAAGLEATRAMARAFLAYRESERILNAALEEAREAFDAATRPFAEARAAAEAAARAEHGKRLAAARREHMEPIIGQKVEAA